MIKTKTTPVLLDRLAEELAKHGVSLKRTHLLQVAARAFGYDTTHTFTADDKAGKLTLPQADYLGCDEVSGYGMMEFFGDPEGGVFAVQKDRIEALAGRKDDWILSPMGGVLDISGLRGVMSTIAEAVGASRVSCSNCEWSGMEEDCKDIADIHQRVGPGETMPAGECPECGCLAHLVGSDASNEATLPMDLTARALAIRNDYHAAIARKHRPDDAMEQLELILRQTEKAILEGNREAARSGIEKYESILALLAKDAGSIDPEVPIYLTNGCCEFAHEYGWMFEGTGLECGSFEDEFYPLTDEESAFIAEDLVTSADGRMHALTGYSALYRRRKHIMPSIEIPVGIEHDAPSYEEVRKTAEGYIAAILPKVQALAGNVLIDSGIDSCVLVQILVPFEKVIELGNQWYPMLEWIMVDPRLPDVEKQEEQRYEGRDYAVDISWVGEGDDGDYDPMRPLDHPLLRFDVQRNIGIVDNEWEDQDDGSYCTQVPAYASPDILQALPRYLAERLDAEGGAHPKRLMEQLSWTGIGHIERFLIAERNRR